MPQYLTAADIELKANKYDEKQRNLPIVPGLIEVDYRYAYRSHLKGLKIGDIVIIPCSWLDELKGNYGTKEATVTSLSSTYTGTVSSVARKKGR